MKIIQYKYTSLFTSFCWLATGFITIYSIVNAENIFYINIVLGILFMGIGFYLYKKSKNILLFLTKPDFIYNSNDENKKVFNHFLIYEFVFTIVSMIVGLIILSAVISRAFIENFPIFG